MIASKRRVGSAVLLAGLMCLQPAFAEEEASLDLVANGFVLISALLVLLMSIPGIALFYGGLVRQKNVLSCIEQSLGVFCLAILLWCICGYSLAFSSSESAGFVQAFVGNLDKALLGGIDLNSLSGSLSEYTFVIFQGAFCAISSCLIVGATVERIRYSAMLLAITLWIIFSYAPLAHQVWGGGFIDTFFESYDFAGGTVVHINAAAAGLVGAFLVGKRNGLGKVAMAPHNLSLTYMGCALLWIGWLGFNAGSQLSSDGVAALAFINTVICPAAAALSWMCGEWLIFKKPSSLGTCSGVIAGLVAITPACAFVGPMGSIVIGLISGLVCLWGVHGFKRATGIDDSLDVFGIHGLGAIVGGVLTGVFCDPALGGVGFKGSHSTILSQVYGQFMSCVVALIWSAVVAYLSFYIADKLLGLRVAEDAEREGLDLSYHGERGYNI
ncbi:MAG: ammonium transporter [Succinivibrio sp.]|nr:ammonium transporter [Succinivibrio sp.]